MARKRHVLAIASRRQEKAYASLTRSLWLRAHRAVRVFTRPTPDNQARVKCTLGDMLLSIGQFDRVCRPRRAATFADLFKAVHGRDYDDSIEVDIYLDHEDGE